MTAAQAHIYEIALSTTTDFNYVFDPQGRFLYVNRALLELWGKTAEEVRGKTFAELDYPPEVAAKLVRQVLDVIATGRPLRDEMNYTTESAVVAYEYIFAPAFDAAGKVEAVAGSTRDITEHKLAEERLLDAQTRLASAMTAAAVGTWVWNVAENRVVADASLAEMFSVSPEQASGAPAESYLAAIHPDDLPAVEKTIRHSLRTGDPYDAEYRVGQGGDEWRWVNARGNVEFDETGRPAQLNGALIDITARKQAEEAIAVQTRALQEAARRKDEFLAMLAHELRNPLASVSNAVSLLKESEDAEDHAWAARVIGRQTGQLARLVDDLLDVSRITRGRIELRREVLDVAPIVESAAEAVAPLIAERGHTLITEVPPGVFHVDADPTRLDQIILNLLTNAAKYSPPQGRIVLHVSRENEDASGPGEVVISVRDDGIGLDPAQIPAMFELFGQGARNPARSEGGLGLGLTIVRALCEMHGGSVHARSDGPDTGSTFTVRFPAVLPPAPSEIAPASASAVHLHEGAGKRILVVDDSADTVNGLTRLLRREGYEVASAEDGAEALDLAPHFQPEIVLLDIGLPGMDGYEVARLLRLDEWCRHSLIVAISGYGQKADIARSQNAGFDRHFVKPVEFANLRDYLATRPPR